MVRSANTVHSSCVKISTISKWTETSFHLSLVIEEYHRVRPKWFLSLWYVWCKPCTYLAPTLTPSPNEPKQDSTWPMSPRSSIGCIQNDCRAYGSFIVNSAPILHQDCHNLPTDQNELPLEPRHLGVSWVHPKWFLTLWHVWHKTMHLSCTDANSISKLTRTIIHTTHIT
jgi:hypothetical protein